MCVRGHAHVELSTLVLGGGKSLLPIFGSGRKNFFFIIMTGVCVPMASSR